jgi:hypothetical protein
VMAGEKVLVLFSPPKISEMRLGSLGGGGGMEREERGEKK